MKKTIIASLSVPGFFSLIFLIFGLQAKGQDTLKAGSALPDEVSKIVLVSCVPCHTSQGGLMSRTKLNFSEWTNYAPEKQKEKAAKMYSETNKGDMPPKKAREQKPETIPTKDQIDIIKKWSESFPAAVK
jgi:mono/diheme cytochrome c family protein